MELQSVARLVAVFFPLDYEKVISRGGSVERQSPASPPEQSISPRVLVEASVWRHGMAWHDAVASCHKA